MYRLRILLVFALLGIAISSRAENELRSFSATYALSIGALKLGEMRRDLRIGTDHTYTFESVMRTSGIAALFRRDRVSEISRGVIRNGRYTPLRYEYDNSRKKRQFALDFDYANGIATSTDNDGSRTVPIPSMPLDKLVYQAQLMRDLTSSLQPMHYQVVDKDETKTYLVKTVGNEDIATPHGRYSTVRLERSNENAKRRTIVWCAESLDWLPVRVDYRDKDGTTTTALLLTLKRE
jgi:Protein of unknown function (DUF3108)